MPARLTINLSNLKHNIESMKTKLHSNQEILAMVKADAYGSGLVETTKYLEENGIRNFGVAYLKEAKKLRAAGVKGKIVVFSGILPYEVEEAVNVDAVYSVSNLEILKDLDKKATSKVKIEIAIDTGMTRLGFAKEELVELASTLKTLNNVEVDGVYTHFSSADVEGKESFTKTQMKLFEECINILENEGIVIPNKHMDNSAGIMKYNLDKYNVVRLGISLYGYYPDSMFKSSVNLKGIFKLTAPICNIRTVGTGHNVSYGGTYTTDKETKIAVLQIGYADGFVRSLSNNFKVLVNGMEAPIIGRICMDTCMIDVTGIDVKLGDEAIIFDYDGVKLEEIANLTNTIHYEIITTIGKRVDREYIR
ncbi:MAG: alanine racemase [Clostridia bacterium]|nr:alanine racemase [Clostridia bacterium]